MKKEIKFMSLMAVIFMDVLNVIQIIEKYNRTIERKSWLEIAGYNVEFMWGVIGKS